MSMGQEYSMMNTRLAILALTAALASTPVLAEQAGQDQPDWLTKQNIGRAVGGVVGGLLGSRFGGGKGQIATTAAGALAGFFVGGVLGERLDTSDKEALSRTTATALDTGDVQTWRNPDTGVSSRVSVEDTRVERRPLESEGLRGKLRETPPLEMVNAFYLADKDSNVRGGPGTEYDVMGRVRTGERVAVVGKVKSEDWYLISDDGLGSGFVYAPLLRRDPQQPRDASAVRVVAGQGAAGNSDRVAREERTCSLVTQQVTLRDGTIETNRLTACRQPDGTWVAV
jgi:uncharacterized protein YgiM (DUF1202 family)